MVHRYVSRVGEVPGYLCGAVCGEECLRLRVCGVKRGVWQMWAYCDWFHDGVVGGVTHGCLGEDFGELVEGGEVDVPTSIVSLEVVKGSSDFLGVFLGIGSPVVFEALAHCAVLTFLVCSSWSDCSDVSLEVRDDTLRKELVVCGSTFWEVDGKLVLVFIGFGF